MPIAHVQSRSTTGSGVTSLALAYSGANTAGNCLIAGAVHDAGDVTSFSDASGNTWSTDKTQTVDPKCAVGSAPNCAAATATVTATFSASSFCSLSIAEYSGLQTSSVLDQTASGTGFGTALSTASVTTTVADELLVVISGRNAANSPITFTPGTNYTERTDSGGLRPMQLADRIVAATGSYAGAATADSTTGWGQVFATYKGAASGHPAIRRTGLCPHIASLNPIGMEGLQVA